MRTRPLLRPTTCLAAVAALLLPALARAGNATVVTSASGFGNLETCGVWLTLTGDDNQNATATATIEGPDDASPRPVHPLARFDATHMATSVFGLRPNTTYTVNITVADADGVTGATQQVTVTTRAEPALPAATHDWYVGPSGDDGNAGDQAHPFATIQHALDQAQPGHHVHVLAGTYHEELSFPRSGTAQAPIALLGEPGAVLDGSDPAVAGAAWTGSGPVYGLATSDDPRFVAVDGARLWHEEDSANCPLGSSTPEHAQGDWCVANGTLYVRLADHSSPASHTVQVAQLNTGIALDGVSFIWVQGMEVRYFGAGDYAKGVYLRSAGDNVISQDALHGSVVNLWLKEGDRNVFQDNDVYEVGMSNWPWVDVKAHDEEAPGIYVSDAVGLGTIIRRNHVHGTFDGIDFCGDSAAQVTTESDVYDNVVDDHLDDGSEADGSCVNSRLFRNTFANVHMGVSLAPASPGPLFVVRNVIYRYGHLAADSVSTPFKFNNGYAPITSNVFIYHTTAVSEDAATGSSTNADNMPALWLGEPGHARGVVFRNNILYGSAYALEASNDTDIQVDLDYDDLVTTDSSRYVRWWDGSAVQHYADVASFAAATGNEAHGLAQAPSFVDLAQGDLRPVAGSAAIDHGVVIAGIDDDFAGSAPDLGAFELGAPAPDAGLSTGTTGSSSGATSGTTGTSSSAGTTGSASSTTGTSGSASTGGAGSTGSAGASSASTGTSGQSGAKTKSGCGCGAAEATPGLWLGAAALAWLRSRRRSHG